MGSFYVDSWHKSPTMNISGNLSASRNGSTISVYCDASNTFKYSGYFQTGYITIRIVSSVHGTVGSFNINAPMPNSGSVSFSFNSNYAQTLSAYVDCCQNNGTCTSSAGTFRNIYLGRRCRNRSL